ncbi:MAG: AAA family ATPase [Deltaproteobacteria bacterium]|nr:AAA family ATPase [Deltaproteobacteria bacterium]
MSATPLPPERLRVRCEPASLPVDRSDQLEPLEHPVGQARAMEAVALAIEMTRDGYNVAVVGEPGAGKHGLVRSMLEAAVKDRATPPDWCYVHDFDHPRAPRALSLPAGRGKELARDLKRLVEDLIVAIPAALETDEYRARVRELEDELEERQRNVFRSTRAKAAERGVALLEMPNGVVFAPLENGEVLPPDQFEKLSDERKKELEKTIAELEESLRTELRKLPRWAKEIRDRARELEREVTRSTVDAAIESTRSRWSELPEVTGYLDRVEKDVIENTALLRKKDEEDGPSDRPGLERYAVNVIVDRSDAKGAPVVYEDLPRVDRLVGRVEQRSRHGDLVSDLRSIKAGALHAANGGFLVLDLVRVLSEPMAWSVLKRSLFAHEVRIEPIASMIGLGVTLGLEPAPIPLSVKVALLGERRLFSLVAMLDSEVADLFKVFADFDDVVDRSDENTRLVLRLVSWLAARAEAPPLDRVAMARLVDECSVAADDQTRLATGVRMLADVVDESALLARRRGSAVIEGVDVEGALAGRERRKGRIREESLRMITDETLVVPTSGARIGEINGLSVLMTSQLRFGRPSRISATARLGSKGVLDIEREVELGGPIHSKGVLILTHFFASRFGRRSPLVFSASLVFEQSYGGVEGDSASLAELLSLMSALSDVPLFQALAVTGSVDQHGRVQAIGGVNEKVEGFFEVCKARGLSGAEGVIIPSSNVRNLMLKDEVVSACERQAFRVIPVASVDEALELITGLPAGEPNESGEYPEGSVNGRVATRLGELAALAAKLRDSERRSEGDPRG